MIQCWWWIGERVSKHLFIFEYTPLPPSIPQTIDEPMIVAYYIGTKLLSNQYHFKAILYLNEQSKKFQRFLMGELENWIMAMKFKRNRFV